jgi:hypothetical protein
MAVKIMRFLAFIFVALALGAGLAHLYALPNKMVMDRDAYLAAQQVYRGWALLGVVVFGQILALLALAVLVRGRRLDFGLTFAALLCTLGAQAIFWAYTYPANQATSNWTMLPADWMALRSQWEYSHAAGAVLTFLAFVLLVLSALAGERPPGSGSKSRKRRGRLEFMAMQ